MSVDDPAVLAHFLRMAAVPKSASEADLRRYGFGFSTVLERNSPFSTKTNLTDPRLDADVWNAYLAIENVARDKLPVASAWQLLLVHLWTNAEQIAVNKERARWWIEQICTGSDDDRRPLLVLHLARSLDRTTAEISERLDKAHHQAYIRADDNLFSTSPVCSTPWWPFLACDAHRTQDLPKEFEPVMDSISRSTSQDWFAWGVEIDQLPPARVRETSIGRGATQIHFSSVLDQDAWSTVENPREPQLVEYGYMDERTGTPRFELSLGTGDGLMFFSHSGSLLCWPRKRLKDASVALAVRAGLISTQDLPVFLARGYHPIPVTAKGQ
jgi:hypothetical protein